MIAYCLNKPVLTRDNTGRACDEATIDIIEWLIEAINEFGESFNEAVQEAGPYFLAALGIILLGKGIDALLEDYSVPVVPKDAIPSSASDYLESEVEPVEVAVNSTAITNYQPVLFPENPAAFHPLGLVMVDRPGTDNGRIITWMDPLSNTAQFRWDENSNFPNGPHYHVLVKGMGIEKLHFYAGDAVPEPAASIYFPLR